MSIHRMTSRWVTTCLRRFTFSPGTLMLILVLLLSQPLFGQSRRIYLANDDHTDFLWTADEETYERVFQEMIDYYLDKETIYSRAEALYEKGEYREARPLFSFVYDTFPNDPLGHKAALAALVQERVPQVMLFGASPLGRELAPRVAYACRCGLTADCTQLEIGDFQPRLVSITGVDVSPEAVERLLSVAIRAPSAGNRQPWHSPASSCCHGRHNSRHA